MEEAQNVNQNEKRTRQVKKEKETSCKFLSSRWRDNTTQYTCLIKAMDVQQPTVVNIDIDGAHKDQKTNEDVRAVHFEECNFEFFPGMLHQAFLHLTHLSVFKCGLKQISRQDLLGLEDLIYFDISDNKLQYVPDDLFDGMRKLLYISFLNNDIAVVSSKLIENLKDQLLMFDFRGNTKANARFGHRSQTTIDEMVELLNRNSRRSTLTRVSGRSSNVDRRSRRLQESTPTDQPKSTAIRKFERLWNSKCFSDFTISASGKEFKVHKAILANESDVFWKMFEQSETGIFKVEATSKSFEEALQFIYTGVNPSPENAIQIFKLSVMYKISDLKDVCGSIIAQNINEANAVDTLELANLHGLDEMKTKAIELIRGMFPGKDLNDGTLNDIKKLREIIEAKQKYESYFR